MVLKDDFNKELLIIDEETLIYKTCLRKIKIKRKDIRSIFYSENILAVLNYSGKIYCLIIQELIILIMLF